MTNNSLDPQSDVKARRRTPRRNGKGSNAAANAHLTDQELTVPSDEFAEKEGGIKLIANQRILPFMKWATPMTIISLILVVASIIALSVKGLNLGLDFTGGVSADVHFSQPVEQTDVSTSLAQKGFDDAVVQYLGTRNELLVRLPPQEGQTVESLNTALTEALSLPDNSVSVSNINIIGSQIGNEIYLNSLMAVGLALVLMMAYIAVRFEFKLALGAVLALFHDVIVVCGLFAIFGWPFDLTVLASILALIGYSVNDTIVVYDRIRENFRRVRGITPTQVLDLSLTETLRRTCMTAGTVLVVVVAMLFMGGDGLYWFALAQLLGLIAGTYSSIYIASVVPLKMGLSREDFIVKVKPEFSEEEVVFADPNLQNAKD